MKAYYKGTGLEFLCQLVCRTRQAFYKRQHRLEHQKFEASIIVELVKRERKIAKRVGSKKLHLILKEELKQHGIYVGKDKFHEILKSNDLIVRNRKRGPKTTNSRHKLPIYPNIAKNMYLDRSEKMWVSDITYIRVGLGFCYLMLITDSYSRKVVGYNFGQNMTAELCTVALKEAMKNRAYPDRKLMHHSDRGSQYCSFDYTKILLDQGIPISMTENGDPLENSLAERMNRIFKDTFALDERFTHYESAKEVVDNAVKYYNERLPHSSVDLLTPSQAHHRRGKLKKHWKWYWRENQPKRINENLYTPN